MDEVDDLEDLDLVQNMDLAHNGMEAGLLSMTGIEGEAVVGNGLLDVQLKWVQGGHVLGPGTEEYLSTEVRDRLDHEELLKLLSEISITGDDVKLAPFPT